MSNMNSRRLTTWTLLGYLLICIMLGSGCGTDEPTVLPSQIFEDVTAQEAFDLIQDRGNDLDFVILDVRTPEEFSEGHIENAVNVDYNSGTFREELNQLDKSMTYLMHCKSGGRSSEAINIMAELDFLEVYHMVDGMDGWEDAGFPVVSSL